MRAFDDLLDLVVEMVDTLGGAPISQGEEWKADHQSLAPNFVLHLNSIWTLSAAWR